MSDDEEQTAPPLPPQGDLSTDELFANVSSKRRMSATKLSAKQMLAVRRDVSCFIF